MICKALPINHSETVKHSQVTDSIVLSFTVEHCQMLHYFAMEKFSINYSIKNIPQPSKREYQIRLISKAESVIKRMRRKTLEFLGKLNKAQNKTCVFVPCNCLLSPSMKCLVFRTH